MMDPIVAEIHAIRAAIMARFNNDLEAYCQYLREEEKKSAYEVVSLPPKKPDPNWRNWPKRATSVNLNGSVDAKPIASSSETQASS